MTHKEIAEYQQAARDGTIPDSKNPLFLFSLTDTELLVDLAKGKWDARQLAKRELVERGLDMEGKWIGYKVGTTEAQRYGRKAKPKTIKRRPGKGL